MSPESREYFNKVAAKYQEQAAAKKVVPNYPKNWGTSNNKARSVTEVWRK